MILDYRKKDDVPPFGRLYEATGEEIDLPVFFANTETGVVLHYVRHKNGGFEMKDDGSGAVEVEKKFKPPLRFVPNE